MAGRPLVIVHLKRLRPGRPVVIRDPCEDVRIRGPRGNDIGVDQVESSREISRALIPGQTRAGRDPVGALGGDCVRDADLAAGDQRLGPDISAVESARHEPDEDLGPRRLAIGVLDGLLIGHENLTLGADHQVFKGRLGVANGRDQRVLIEN